jgi:hypothetical protein
MKDGCLAVFEGEKYTSRASSRPMGGVNFVRVFNCMVLAFFAFFVSCLR